MPGRSLNFAISFFTHVNRLTGPHHVNRHQAIHASPPHGMRYVLAMRPYSSSGKHDADGRRVYERHGFAGGKRFRRTITMAILSLFATLACVVTFSRRAIAGGPGLFAPTSYQVVPGFFAQSLNSTNDSTFDFVPPRLRLRQVNTWIY